MPSGGGAQSGRIGARFATLTIATLTIALSVFACGEVLSLEPWNAPAEGGAPDSEPARSDAEVDATTRCGDPRVVLCDGFDLPWSDEGPSGWSLHTSGVDPPVLARSENPVRSAPSSITAESLVPDGAPQSGGARLFVHQLASPVAAPFAVDFDLYLSEAPAQSFPGATVIGAHILMANFQPAVMTQVLALGYRRQQDVVSFYPCLANVGPTAGEGVPPATWLHLEWTVTLTEERLKVTTQDGAPLLVQARPEPRVASLENLALGMQVIDHGGRWLVHYDNARVRQLN